MTIPSIALNLDPFGKGRKAVPDSVQRVVPEVDELVERAYKEYLTIPISGYFDKDFDEYMLNVSQKPIIKDRNVLNPSQIELLLEKIIGENPLKVVNDWNTGLFLTAIIQISYTYGHNNFTLTTGDSHIVYIGHELKGTIDNKIIITVDGNVGADCGQGAEYSIFRIQGNANYGCGLETKFSEFNIQGNADYGCGLCAGHSDFSINGDAGNDCGSYAEYTNFNIRGNAGGWCGEHAERSYFNIYGNAEKGCGEKARFSKFTVHSQDLFKRLRKDLGITNRLALTDDSGKVTKKVFIL
jgi:glutamate synthase domain-containing protein 3